MGSGRVLEFLISLRSAFVRVGGEGWVCEGEEMGLERLESYDEAMKELLRPQWLSGIMDSRKKEQTLKTVLEHSRRSYFLDKFEEEPVLCQHLTWMLRDKMAYTYVTTIQTLRILRNACARREKNQMQCELTGAQNGVINTLVMLIPTNSGSESSAHADLALKRIKSTNFRLRNEYVLYGIQFLCNFCTGNVTKDNGVWDSLSPEIFEELFKLPDDNIFAATAALFHNCIASKPTRMHAVRPISSHLPPSYLPSRKKKTFLRLLPSSRNAVFPLDRFLFPLLSSSVQTDLCRGWSYPSL